jgi:murein DD-endopeptidase MepM/ murein hydrolase activator NlpD
MGEPMPDQANSNDLPPHMAVFQEPPFDPEDTSPTGIVRRDATAPITDRVRGRAGWPWLNWLLSGAAAVITVIAAVLYSQQVNRPTPRPTAITTSATNVPATPLPTNQQPSTLPVQAPAVNNGDSALPADVIAELLMQPGDTAPPSDKIYRMQTAYTIAPARPRAGVEEYTIQPGDTLDKIAQRFGISKDTLIWNNDDIYVNKLDPGDKLTIMPENGIRHKTAGDETIQSIAEKYKVSPYAIIDSEYNRLQNARPETLLPPGQVVIVPGGASTKKAVYWNPGIVTRPSKPVITGGAGASTNPQGEISFGGGPGSCGYVPNVGGTGSLRVPLGRYTVIRGFFPGHSGIDLAAPIGTTVFAADGGTVAFAGWSNWGYGNTIVLAHGSMLTLYGHLSRISVRCGQQVGAGAPIGQVGSTGNSSGPHLHFEIRPGAGEPVNPAGILAF